MADINPTENPEYLADLFGCCGRDPAHHREADFFGVIPGIEIVRLRDTLALTRQSPSRVLRRLVRNGIVAHQSAAPANDQTGKALSRTEDI
ncbi:MAG: hypothetical protein HQ511_13285 [Rhodospirillales bacterium]|nr:hypothetical protein [Rhodospirillales bacterium]